MCWILTLTQHVIVTLSESRPHKTPTMPQASKCQKLQFDHRTPSPDSDDVDSHLIPTAFFRNTQLASPECSWKALTTYLPTKGSPTKSQHEHNKVQWNDKPSDPLSPGEINLDEYPFLDPAYIHQCNLDEPDHKPQHCTAASVRFQSQGIHTQSYS